MASAVTVRGTSGVVANIYAAQERVGREIRAANREFAPRVRDRAREYAPRDTGNLEESLTYRLSPDDLVFEVFHDPAFYDAAPYYIYQELGFIHYQSGKFIVNPHLFPAWEEERPAYRGAISAAIAKAVR